MGSTNSTLIAIDTWNRSRSNAAALIELLNQGYSFTINRSQYDAWCNVSSDVTELHIYPAVFDGVMKFVAVDNVTDANESINFKNVFTLDYTFGKVDLSTAYPSGGSNVSIQEALERMFRWMMNKNGWIASNISTRTGNMIFQVYVVPFSDLAALFNTSSNDHIFGLIGLENQGDNAGLTDILLWDDTVSFVDPASVQDVSYQCPPFNQSMDNFQLLQQSGQ